MMNYSINETHDPSLLSWVESANAPDIDFPIQNLPFGVFKRHGRDEPARVGVAIGDEILDVTACRWAGLFAGKAERAAIACAADSLNGLMSLGPDCWSALRLQTSRLLRSDCPGLRGKPEVARSLTVPLAAAEMLVPASIGDYTDFYASIYHASNVGSMLRPDNPLLPNYKWVPIGYHGRASSIVVSGSGIRRPTGQLSEGQGAPAFAPSGQLDYELEVGFLVGQGNRLGRPIPIEEAGMHLFGMCLVNDWSARDVQRWEYQPLGPFLSKSFGTTISPWVVTMEAMEPYRCAAFRRPEGDPEPLPYLYWPQDAAAGGFDLHLEVSISSVRMRRAEIDPICLVRSNLKEMYWTAAQLVTHHASNGCSLRSGDLLASGTVSGPDQQSVGSLLELTRRGAQPVILPGGESRTFLGDGDEVIFRGSCERPGFSRIGYGDCRGTILPAV